MLQLCSSDQMRNCPCDSYVLGGGRVSKIRCFLNEVEMDRATVCVRQRALCAKPSAFSYRGNRPFDSCMLEGG